jgi:hypothetical protein
VKQTINQKAIEIPDGMNKGELMKTVYTIEELANIDASLPIEIHLKYGIDSFYLVMNYNDNIFGELEDMRSREVTNEDN